MRQGQQNRRGRGRGRKPQNPLARSFESNGPDVKIRGTAAHVAEKYMSLARDAHVSGDPVTAESYLQHAEHYNRIIMAAQLQAAPPAQTGEQANSSGHSGHSGHRGNRQSPDTGEEATPAAETVEMSAGEGGAPQGDERGQGRQGRNGAQPAPESRSPEPVEAAVADEGENTPDAVS